MNDRAKASRELIDRLHRATLNRRQMLYRAGVLGVSASTIGLRTTGAQDATPSDGGGSPQQSITRDEYKQQLQEAFPIPDDATQGGTFIYGESTDIGTTNLMLGSDDPTNPIIGLVQEGLTGSSPVDGQYVPGLADSWEISGDGLTYTYTLTDKAKWHDGEPFTADDVIFSMDAQSNPDTGSSYTGSFTNTVKSYTKVDDRTVEVTAVDVFAPVVFLGNSYCPIVPKHIWEGVEFSKWASDPGSTGQDPARVIGTGPFKFEEWVQGEKLTLVRNDDYWDDIPHIDTFIMQVWPDDASAIEALRAGDIDLVNNPPPADVESLQAEDNIEVAIYDTYDFGFWAYNLDTEKTKVFQDVEVRQALIYAVDRQSVVDNIQLGLAEVAQGSQAKLSVAYAPDKIQTKYDFDAEKAQQLLDSAGWTLPSGGKVREKDGQKLSFALMYPTGNAATEQQIAFFQESWAKIGVEAKPNPVDFGSVLVPTITDTFDYEMVVLGFSWDATGDQSAMFSSDQYKVGFNFMKYSNPKVDELNMQANRELDPEKRRDLLIESANLVNDDAPVGIVSFRQDRMAYNIRAKGYTPNDLAGWQWPIQYLYIEE
jgi:peptide/nickel transport system substrate-binding protein